MNCDEVNQSTRTTGLGSDPTDAGKSTHIPKTYCSPKNCSAKNEIVAITVCVYTRVYLNDENNESASVYQESNNRCTIVIKG